jgi:hypothetical protein
MDERNLMVKYNGKCPLERPKRDGRRTLGLMEIGCEDRRWVQMI